MGLATDGAQTKMGGITKRARITNRERGFLQADLGEYYLNTCIPNPSARMHLEYRYCSECNTVLQFLFATAWQLVKIYIFGGLHGV